MVQSAGSKSGSPGWSPNPCLGAMLPCGHAVFEACFSALLSLPLLPVFIGTAVACISCLTICNLALGQHGLTWLGMPVQQDYVDIMEFLLRHWNIAGLSGLTPEAQKAQEDVQSLLTKFKRLTERQERVAKSKAVVPTSFSWIFNREVPVLQV